jgi:hypothetical protein
MKPVPTRTRKRAVRRTNVELREDHLAKLRELALRRGDRGFAKIIAEALEKFFSAAPDEAERRARAIEALGTLSGEDAARLRAKVAKMRGAWR